MINPLDVEGQVHGGSCPGHRALRSRSRRRTTTTRHPGERHRSSTTPPSAADLPELQSLRWCRRFVDDEPARGHNRRVGTIASTWRSSTVC
ncbi:hypothetical protein HBB16_18370 [Pseudonocardia sp. MCCB 268]|nr:hypothetical protein [Pseudonocardia cytotoxica]